MATEINSSSATIKGPLCDVDRLAHAMESRGLDGLVITTHLNVTYLSGFNPTAPKADEPPGNAVDKRPSMHVDRLAHAMRPVG